MTDRIDVAVGVIIDGDNVLIAKRPANLHQGDKWEFPGGKIEAKESVIDALTRELQEELGIAVSSAYEWFSVSHDYSDKSVCLHMCVVNTFTGTPKGNEGQPVRWVSINHLSEYEFPAANAVIINRLSEVISNGS